MSEESQSQRIDTLPDAERQAELEATYEQHKNTESPYKDVQIATYGELHWVFQQRQWSGENALPEGKQRPNLSGAHLENVNLSGAYLVGVTLSGAHLVGVTLSGTHLENANLSGAILWVANLSGAHLWTTNLSEAHLRQADLSGAQLVQADLSRANLQGATLSRADLREADLSRAHLFQADLSRAHLQQAHLSGADLVGAKFDSDTNLAEITLSSATVLRDIRWNGADVTSIGWQQLLRLGDDVDRSAITADKARANRQIATLLRSQGISAQADRFAYRANVFERQANLSQNPLTWLPWLGSLLLDVVAGYGYKPGRILFWYLVTIAGFMLLYMKASEGWIPFGLPTPTSLPRLPWYEALILSVSSFHGRGFFQPVQSLGDPIAALAAIEAVVGLFIEVSFIATFTQRFFGK